MEHQKRGKKRQRGNGENIRRVPGRASFESDTDIGRDKNIGEKPA